MPHMGVQHIHISPQTCEILKAHPHEAHFVLAESEINGTHIITVPVGFVQGLHVVYPDLTLEEAIVKRVEEMRPA